MKIRNIVLSGIFACIALAGSVQAQDAGLVDGSMWSVSSEEEKEAYLIGAGNFMTIELIVQSKADTELTEHQTAVDNWAAGLDDVTINQMVATIDAWYSANSGSMETPVLVVLWNSYVEAD
jgi:hypothetical protein